MVTPSFRANSIPSTVESPSRSSLPILMNFWSGMTFSSCWGSIPRISGASRRLWNSTITGPCTNGAVATTPGVLSILALSGRHSRNTSSEVTRMCASKSMTFCRNSRSNPVMTAITRISTVTPSITPMTEINVIIERNVRFGFKYLSARKRLKGSFNSSLGWRQTQRDSTAASMQLLLGPRYRVRLQFFQRDELERRSMRCFQIHRRRAVVIQRAFPAGDAHTPLVAWLQSGKTPLRMRCDQVVSIQDGEIQKFLRDLHANRVLPHVLWSCAAIAIAIKTGHRIATTTFQFRSQNIRRHMQLGVTIGGNFTGRKANANPREIRAYQSDRQRLEKTGPIL